MTEKQIGRYLRYRLAFERLDEALLEGWLLEAISLEESIISDRLLSVLKAYKADVPERQGLGNLITQTKKAITGSGSMIDEDIFTELDQWRNDRNECVHGFCKLDHLAYVDNSAEIFGEKMWATAKRGRDLVDTVNDLSRQVKKELG